MSKNDCSDFINLNYSVPFKFAIHDEMPKPSSQHYTKSGKEPLGHEVCASLEFWLYFREAGNLR